MERVAASDEDAFAELFRQYGSAAFGLATRILADRTLAEEVVQEVFLSVWRKAERYDGARGSVRSWLLTQVHHKAVDIVRREEAERRRSTPDSSPAADAPTPEDVIEDHWLAARRDQVRGVLDVLPSEQRAVIELCYFEGLTQSQAASRLGTPLGTVKSRTVTAMRRMREALIARTGEAT